MSKRTQTETLIGVIECCISYLDLGVAVLTPEVCVAADEALPSYLRVPRNRRQLMQEYISPQLPVLVSYRIMKRVSSHISPEPVQADLQRCRPCPCDLKHPRSNPQPGVSGDHLDTGYPFGDLSSLLRREGRPVCRVTAIKRSKPLAGSISQRLAGAEVREEVTVSLEDIELVRGRDFVIASEGPRPR